MSEAGDDDLLRRVHQLAHRLPPALVARVCAALNGAATASAAGAVIPDPFARAELEALLRCWTERHPTQGWTPLAWALQAASWTDCAWRAETSLELVWTGPAPHSGMLRRTGQALIEIIDSAQRELWLVAFVGYRLPEVRKALERAGDRRVTIRLIMESPEESDGRISFSVLQGLGHGLVDLASVYVWPLEKRRKDERGQHGSLHVKCALADDRALFVTSANLTDYAVQLNMELGLLVKGGDVPRRVGDHLRWLIGSGQLAAAKLRGAARTPQPA